MIIWVALLHNYKKIAIDRGYFLFLHIFIGKSNITDNGKDFIFRET